MATGLNPLQGALDNMKIIPFNRDKHTEILKRLLRDRCMDVSLTETMPKHGWIALEGDLPVVIGFLRRIECNYAMIDGLISNPIASSELRDSCIQRLSRKLIDVANRAKVKKIIAFTSDTHTFMRAVKSFGFREVNTKLIELTLPSRR